QSLGLLIWHDEDHRELKLPGEKREVTRCGAPGRVGGQTGPTLRKGAPAPAQLQVLFTAGGACGQTGPVPDEPCGEQRPLGLQGRIDDEFHEQVDGKNEGASESAVSVDPTYKNAAHRLSEPALGAVRPSSELLGREPASVLDGELESLVQTQVPARRAPFPRSPSDNGRIDKSLAEVDDESLHFARSLLCSVEIKSATDFQEVIHELLGHFPGIFVDVYGGTPAKLPPLVIDLQPGARPVALPVRRVSDAVGKAISEQIDDWLRQKIIYPSASAWAAPLHAVKKRGPDGKLVCPAAWRITVDYRRLNLLTVRDAGPVPLVAALFDAVPRTWRLFASIDWRSGYLQLAVAPASQHLTSFVAFHHGVLKQFAFATMPFGLVNAPAHFERCATTMLDGLLFKVALNYFDNCLIGGSSERDHTNALALVLGRCAHFGVRLRRDKCIFGAGSVPWLGHVLSPGLRSPDPSRIKAILEVPAPTCVRELRAFAGLCSYYRAYIPRLSSLMAGLSDLTRKDTPWDWTPERQRTFDLIKTKFGEAISLTTFDPNRTTILQADASEHGVGAALVQQDSAGAWRPISFLSRAFGATERRWRTIEQECYAVVWAVTSLHVYLVGHFFTIFTDHRNLLYLGTCVSPKVERWRNLLLEFDFAVRHVPGRMNLVADFLSRTATGSYYLEETKKLLEVPASFADAVKAAAPAAPPATPRVAHFTPTSCFTSQLCGTFLAATGDRRPRRQGVRQPGWLVGEPLQANPFAPAGPDGIFPPVTALPVLPVDETPETIWGAPVLDLIKLAQAAAPAPKSGRLTLDGERCGCKSSGGRIWLPDSGPVAAVARRTLLSLAHDHPLSGHVGISRTRTRLADFCGRHLDADVRRWVSSCPTCQRLRAAPDAPDGEPVRWIATAPMEVLHLDFVGPLPVSDDGYLYALAVVDRFTRYTWICPTHRADAEATCHAFLTHIVGPFGVPAAVSSDRGSHFVNELVRSMEAALSLPHRFSLAAHPQSQGRVERQNRVWVDCLRALLWTSARGSAAWPDFLPAVALAINSACSSATGECPGTLMFGRPLRTPVSDILRPRVPAVALAEMDYRQRMLEGCEETKRLHLQADRHQRLALDTDCPNPWPCGGLCPW
ncbi:MAG: hypothetical protein QG597_4639, partial [Actinomycetota bacterium]|nr:hypothetical protein [Actinomycetota bacterium]